MELHEYQSLAMRTAKMFDTTKMDLIHAALGLSSEPGELSLTIAQLFMRMPSQPDNIPEELGDGCWYAALMCHINDWKFEDMILEPAMASDMSPELAGAVVTKNPIALSLLLNHFAGEITSTIKAHAIYNKPLDGDLLKKNLQLYVTTASLLSDIHGMSFEDVTLKGNILKLAKRYPDKYTDADAIARADKAPDPEKSLIVH